MVPGRGKSPYLGMFFGGNERPHSEADWSLSVDVEVGDLLSPASVPVSAALAVRRCSRYFLIVSVLASEKLTVKTYQTPTV